MRTPGLAAITMAFAIAACSDVAAPTAMISDLSSPEAVAHKSFSESQRSSGRRLGDKKDNCDDNDHDRRWGKRGHHHRFRHWGSRHDRRHWHFRGHENDACEPAPATGTISGTVMNESQPAAGYAVYLLNADGSVAASGFTDAAGAYSLVGPAGDYLVCEENPFTLAHGFLGETKPGATATACPGSAYGPRGFSLKLVGGTTLGGNNFSNMVLEG